jgi:hypothetical protein
VGTSRPTVIDRRAPRAGLPAPSLGAVLALVGTGARLPAAWCPGPRAAGRALSSRGRGQGHADTTSRRGPRRADGPHGRSRAWLAPGHPLRRVLAARRFRRRSRATAESASRSAWHTRAAGTDKAGSPDPGASYSTYGGPHRRSALARASRARPQPAATAARGLSRAAAPCPQARGWGQPGAGGERHPLRPAGSDRPLRQPELRAPRCSSLEPRSRRETPTTLTSSTAVVPIDRVERSARDPCPQCTPSPCIPPRPAHYDASTPARPAVAATDRRVAYTTRARRLRLPDRDPELASLGAATCRWARHPRVGPLCRQQAADNLRKARCLLRSHPRPRPVRPQPDVDWSRRAHCESVARTGDCPHNPVPCPRGAAATASRSRTDKRPARPVRAAAIDRDGQASVDARLGTSARVAVHRALPSTRAGSAPRRDHLRSRRTAAAARPVGYVPTLTSASACNRGIKWTEEFPPIRAKREVDKKLGVRNEKCRKSAADMAEGSGNATKTHRVHRKRSHR